MSPLGYVMLGVGLGVLLVLVLAVLMWRIAVAQALNGMGRSVDAQNRHRV